MEKNIIFTGIGDNLLNVINYFIKDKNVKVCAVIPLWNAKGTKKFVQNIKKISLSNQSILNLENINSSKSINKIKKLSPDLICNWGHNQLFGKELLNIPKIGCLNIHPGLLPNGRGSGAVQGEVINKKQVGWSCHLMDNKFDKGFLISQKKLIFKKDKIPYLNEIIKKLLYNADKFYVTSIKKVLMNKNLKKKKLTSFGRYYPKFSPGDEFIDWNDKSDHILRKIRSRSPQILSITYIDKLKKKYFVKKATKSKVKTYKFVNGQIIDKDKKKGVLVKTGDTALWLSLGSFDKKKFKIPNFKIGTCFYTNSIGNTFKLLEKINNLEKKLKRSKLT